MFYSLVRSYMGFRKLHSTVQKKKGARCRARSRKETGYIVDDRQDITTVILGNVTNGLGLCIVEAKVGWSKYRLEFTKANLHE